MTTWTNIPTSVLDVGKPVRSIDIIALRDNISAAFEKAAGAPVLANSYIVTAMIADSQVTNSKLGANSITTDKIADGNVVEADLGNGAVAQAKLKTTTGEVSTTNTTLTNLTLPGGTYGFYPQVRGNPSDVNCTARIAEALTNSSYSTNIALAGGSGGSGAFAQQRYVQGSPPYDLGDGEVPLFVFALVDSLGNVTATYIAEDPPWANNGPTDIRVDFYERGRAWQRRRLRVSLAALLDLEMRERELERIAASELIEVTQALKQADMPLVPHPFLFNNLNGRTVVLLDPVSILSARLRDLHLSGESVAGLLHARHLRLSNSPLTRCCPPGVIAVAASWR